MVSKIRFGYEGKFYDAFDVTFYDEQINSAVTRRVADERLEEALFGSDGDYVDITAQHIDEGVFYYLSDEEMKKSLEDIECIVYCVYHNKNIWVIVSTRLLTAQPKSINPIIRIKYEQRT